MTIHLRAANMRPATFNAEARTIEAIVSTGAAVARPGYTGFWTFAASIWRGSSVPRCWTGTAAA